MLISLLLLLAFVLSTATVGQQSGSIALEDDHLRNDDDGMYGQE